MYFFTFTLRNHFSLNTCLSNKWWSNLNLIPLINGDYKPYSGCYVNAIIGGLWCSEKYSPTIGANLDGVQFYADGVPFSAGGASAEDFDAFGDDDDDEF